MFWHRAAKGSGACAEDAALRYLKKQNMSLLARNFQPAGRGMADLDLVMQERDGTVVFVEVRLRTHTGFGGAGESISAQKQRRLIQAARYFLMRYRTVPATRYDVVAFEDEALTQPLWLRSAFEVRDNG